MTTNFFFNNYTNSQEQLLIEDLVVESIRMYGQDMYYMPRALKAKDEIYGEDPSSEYKAFYNVELYIKNVEGFEGEGEFLSKFNLEIRDKITFTIAKKVYDNEIAAVEATTRPQEGDLIYFPINQKLYQVKFVEHEAIFYQLGSIQTYDLQCELFEYSGELLQTGLYEVDDLMARYSFITSSYALYTEDKNYYSLTDEDGFKLSLEWELDTVDPISDNNEIQAESDAFIDFSEIDPFSTGAV